MSQPNVAVILSGCGVFDGTEIHEAVLTLLALDRRGAAYQCYAPDIPQHHVLDHRTGQEMDETRNVLVESSRIARGDIKDIRELKAADVDALMFPGGFGAAKNLSTFAFEGEACSVNEDVARVVREAVEAGKPIGALCITPAVMARVLEGATVTLGAESEFSAKLAPMGARHQVTTHGEIVVDERYRLVTSPCYMLDARVSQIADGADNTVKAVLDMVRAAAAQAAQ